MIFDIVVYEYLEYLIMETITFDLWRCDDGFGNDYVTIAIQQGIKTKPIEYFIPTSNKNLEHVGLIMMRGDFHMLNDYFIV